MGYVAVKGGQDAIANAKLLIEYYRTRDLTPPVEIEQIRSQFRMALDKIMGEGGFYDPEYAAIAFKQAEGDIFEGAFILRAFRATLERRYFSDIISTRDMYVMRRISSSFREIPGGQVLGPTKDYTQRTLDVDKVDENLAEWQHFLKELEERIDPEKWQSVSTYGKVIDLLRDEGLLKAVRADEDRTLKDITREAIKFPAPRSARLQAMARAETGGLMAMGYSSMRGFGSVHPTVGELRYGAVKIHIRDPRGHKRYIGKIKVTEAEMISKVKSPANKKSVPYFSIGYGLCFGQNDTKAICMGILDRSMRDPEGGSPSNDQEFVLYHTEGIESYGFTNHLKLPHYVTFMSGLDNLRRVLKNEGLTETQNTSSKTES